MIREAVVIKDSNETTAMIIIKQYSDNSYGLIITIMDNSFGCTDEHGSIYLTSTDSARFKAINESDFNCEGRSMIIIGKWGGNSKVKNFILNHTIMSIKVNGRTNSYQADIPIEEAIRFRNACKCIFSNQ